MDFNVYDVVAAVASNHPQREAIAYGERRLSFARFIERANRFANGLLAAGMRPWAERSALAAHESGQAHVALYLRNCPEYIEAMVGCFGARAVPINVNYRYVADEVAYLFDDASISVIVFQSAFSSVVGEVVAKLNTRPALLLQVDDGSDEHLLDGAHWYEDWLTTNAPVTPPVDRTADDLYALYTGGTTGMPKGVLWRQGDAFVPLFGGRRADGTEWRDLDEIVAAATADGSMRLLAGAPLMHAAGQWPAMRSLVGGHTLVLLPDAGRFDAAAFARTLDVERVTNANVVGDAFLWPFIDELDRVPRALPHLRRIATGGIAASARAKQALLQRLPHIDVLETAGSSETGAILGHESHTVDDVAAGTFRLLTSGRVLSEDRSRVMAPGDDEIGWLAAFARVPIGYLGDPIKSAATFPVIDGVRYSVPGDRVAFRADGIVELHGRESGTINTGGEKVFAEEVERALLEHAAVRDVVVCGRPSARWGSEVVALVVLDAAAAAIVDDGELRDAARGRLAPYKVPKAFIRVDEVRRGPAGKIDYRWAHATAAADPTNATEASSG